MYKKKDTKTKTKKNRKRQRQRQRTEYILSQKDVYFTQKEGWGIGMTKKDDNRADHCCPQNLLSGKQISLLSLSYFLRQIQKGNQLYPPRP